MKLALPTWLDTQPRAFLAVLALGVCTAFGAALVSRPAQAIEVGKEYQMLSPAQPTDARGKVEVIEFFAYTCPHCFQFEPDLAPWVRKQPRDVAFKRVPAVFNEKWEPMARAFYTLETLGQLDKLHVDVFEALHVQEQNLTVPAAFFDWAARHGLDRKKVEDTYQSFGVSAKLARAKQMSKDYKIAGVPAVVVNGKYLTSASLAGSHAKVLGVLDSLIDQERNNKTRKR